MLRQGCLQGSHCLHGLPFVSYVKCRARPRSTAASSRRHLLRPAAAAAADAPPAEKKKRGRPPKAAQPPTPEEEKGEEEMPMELPTPLDYQQTLIKSFTLGGIGLHSGEYAVVRVRPAFAGEGRYFVRVPDGTNSGRFLFDDGNDKKDQIPMEQALEEVPTSDAVEDARVEWYRRFLAAQEEDGFIGTFTEFLDSYVSAKQLDNNFRNQILDIKQEYPEPDVEPDFSLEPEDIVQLDESDPTLVRANIESVKEVGMPYTQLGEGDNRVMGVELMLAALEACGVDNCRIEIEGGNEIPVLDNSALGWCIDIQCAGLRPAPVQDANDDNEEDNFMQRDVLILDKAVAAVTKSLAGQVTLFPVYTTLVLLYASLLEGQGLHHGLDKLKHKIPKLFATGSVYWPVVNVVNFLYVPPARRILALNACAIMWNAYLSYVNAAPIPAVDVAAPAASTS